jgi:ABC-type Fe3+-hydroxamate transport system substrate-binding protein
MIAKSRALRPVLILFALAFTTPLGAQDMRTITDDTGAVVTFPAHPQRIASAMRVILSQPGLKRAEQ